MGDRIAQLILEKIDTPPVERRCQDLDNTVRGSGGFGSTGVNEKNNTGEKNEMGKNERTEVKNETLKGSSGSRTKTDRSRKTTETSSKLSRERQIISVK